MTKASQTFFTAYLLCCGPLLAATVPADKASPPAKPEKPQVTADPGGGARVVQYGDRDVIQVKARLRFTTLIVLPRNEQIMDFVCGDKEYWVVNGAQNFAYIKPAKEGSRTNLNLVAASGNVYSFVLAESSEGEPDLKLFVELRDETMISALAGAPSSSLLSRSTTSANRRRSRRPKRATPGSRHSCRSTLR